MHATLPRLKETDFPRIVRKSLTTLQVNLGYRCNQTCLHCHVNAGPTRKEQMSHETIGDVLRFLKQQKLQTLDVTGGAPELNPHFRYLVEQAHAIGAHIIDRCNLTVLFEPGQEDTADFLRRHQVEIVASLPCYMKENIDAQRGNGVYEKSMDALRQLNALGYGHGEGGLTLNLVYNPTGDYLPPPQAQLEADYRRELAKQGIVFSHLFTLANLPIQRFGSTLISKGKFDDYMALLMQSHQDANLEHVMCRSMISVDWQGYVYDCDFNQMLGMPLLFGTSSRPKLRDIMQADLTGNPIAIANHCYGCTAGQGSSCGGALLEE